eukprot:Phypoly_transcript_01265.p1 GENE.Phypoly_transcript_01265~~Phypoly_transcript_01265.p1  ORF type:complete len:798 (+),score=125.42 Phypoly_transcript_01265:116-2395(+)
MSAPFVVDETFKRKISYLKVTELHTLLRSLGVSYQANKDQLVKRLIVKYSQIYEQYCKGLVPYEEAKRFGDWINENNIVYTPPVPQVISPPKPQPSPSTSITRTKPIVINVPHTTSSYGGDLSSYQSASSNQYTSTSNNNNNNSNSNNNYYNYNMYAQSNSGGKGYYGSNSLPKPTPSYTPLSGSSKATSIDISQKPPSELIFPKSVDPFLEIETTLVSVRLKSFAESRGRPTSIAFNIPDSYLNSVRAGTSRVIVRSFEIHNNLAHVSHPHSWPPDCTLSINGAYMSLGIKKQTKPNAPPHPDKPLDVSKECRQGRNTVDITTSSSRQYAVVIDVMRVISVDTLVDVVTKNKTVSFESAKKTLSLALGGDDKDIAALHTTVSLQCPLGRTPLIIPVKSLACRHIQCFDLRNYLMMNQRTPSWKCPVCSAVANTTNLVIDAYFTELLRNVDNQIVSEIHIDPSGNWSTVKPNKSVTPKPEPTSPTVMRAISAPSPVTPSPQKPKRAVEVIDLLSDDDDDVIAMPPKRAKPNTTPRPPPPPVSSFVPPSPPPLVTSLPYSSTTTFAETTTTYAYPIISSPPSTPPATNASIASTSDSSTPTIESFIPLPSDTIFGDFNTTSHLLQSQPLVPIVTSLPDDILPGSPPSHNPPLLQSDLVAPPPLATPDTPPEVRKKNSIIVKLRLSSKPSPMPNIDALRPVVPSSPSLQSAVPSPPPQAAMTSPTPPTPPPPSVPSESSDALSSLEVPNLAPFPSGTHTPP